jgi:glycine hydroxymethyltransferase
MGARAGEGRVQPVQLSFGRASFGHRPYSGRALRPPVDDLDRLVQAHERWRGSETINLQPSENVLSGQARALLASDFAGRYSLPERYAPALGEIGNTYRGTRFTDAVEEHGEALARDLFAAPYASLKPLSGHLAGFLLLQSTCKRGDLVLAISAEHGGYDGYMPGFVPEYLGLRVEFLPFDSARWNVNVRAAADAILEKHPRLVLLGASQFLFPYDLRGLRGACDDVGAILGYDASHVLGLIAGGLFQRPMLEGVDVLSASTHKSFPGPQGGIFLANRADVFARAMDTITWHIQDNAHWNRIAATAHVLREMKAYGPAYARQIVANTKALGRQLDKWGFPLRFKALGFSESHQLLVDSVQLRARWSLGPKEFADRLERNNIIVDAVGRLGTNEITRMGGTEEHMQTLAGLMVRAARNEDVRTEVIELRGQLHLSYVFEASS